MLTMANSREKIAAHGVEFPQELTGKVEKYPERTVTPHTVRVGDETIAGLCLFCSQEDLNYFRIRIPPPKPNFKFRFRR